MYKTETYVQQYLYNFLKPFGFNNKNKRGHNTDKEIAFLRSYFANENVNGDPYFKTIKNKLDKGCF